VRRSLLLSLVTVALVAAGCSYTPVTIAPIVPVTAQTSRVFAADGTQITEFRGEENRSPISYADLPQDLVDAVVAIEDARFWLHNGIDLIGLIRAARTNVDAGGIRQGGSTITQQLVENLFVGDADINDKIESASMAIQMERSYTKEAILEIYLNTIYFGKGAYGVEAAAETYFGRSASTLSLGESALIAGLIKFPNAANPLDFPVRALDRRDIVLDAMLALDLISADEHEAALVEPLDLAPPTPLEDLRYRAPHFVEEVRQWFLTNPEFGATREERADLLFGGGLRIQTTVDLQMQAEAERAIADVLADPLTAPESAIVALEPSTGRVRAMVGGRDFFGESSAARVNLAMGLGRQGGSSFKPFVLATALEMGIPMSQTYPAPRTAQFEIGGGAPVWEVTGGSGGSADLRRMTVSSYNTAYAALMLDVGAANAIRTATALGIDTPLRPNPAAVLGSENVTALGMANAFASFANRGLHVPPYMVERILRPDGTVLYEHGHTQQRAVSTDTADQVTDALVGAIESGTGRSARLPGRDAAGKTGTAADFRDAWFVGYTPQLATAVWVGYPTAQISMVPPVTPIRVFGGTYPAQIWQRFMAAALADEPVLEFAPPPTTTTIRPPRPSGGSATSSPTTLGLDEDGDGIEDELPGAPAPEPPAAPPPTVPQPPTTAAGTEP
jgi:penicillin-binding protein 1A